MARIPVLMRHEIIAFSNNLSDLMAREVMVGGDTEDGVVIGVILRVTCGMERDVESLSGIGSRIVWHGDADDVRRSRLDHASTKGRE